MLKINAILLGKVENANDYLVFYTRKFMVVRLSELLRNIGSFHIEREGNDDNIIQMYNATIDTSTLNVKYEDGVSEDKHWKLVIDESGMCAADNKNVMVLGKIGNKYLIVQPKGNKNIVVNCATQSIAGNMQIYSAEELQTLNEKLKSNKLKLVNAKVVNSKKTTSDGQKIVYVQSFSGGIHYLVEGEKGNLRNLDDIARVLYYLITLKPCKSSEYVDNLNKVYKYIEEVKANKINVTRDKLELLYEFILKGLSETDEKIGILTVDWSKQLLKLINWGIALSNTANEAESYVPVDSIVQSIARRCASAIEEAPSQANIQMTGKNIQIITKDSQIKNDKNSALKAIVRLNVGDETKYLLSRIVKDENLTKLVVQVYVTESDRSTVIEHKVFQASLENMNDAKARLFCKRFKIKFSETVIEALRVLHK